ncbi:MAG TPA: tetratricopeptide repeat protein [Acetobacteraceae bacterium]|nr:tetratricopeptide repeat protein [Acetobacteraceae bacterium]
MAMKVSSGQRPAARFPAAVVVALAVGACSGAAPGDSSPRKISMRVADAALSSGAPDLALRVAELALKDDPHNLSALIAQGDALYALGQSKAAQESYRSAIDIDPSVPAALLGFGRTQVKANPAAAESAFLAALRADTTSVAALNDLGVARDLQGRSSEALEAYHLALSIAPDSPDVKVNLGRSLMLAGRTSDAAAVLREVAANPQSAQQYQKELAASLTLSRNNKTGQQEADKRGDPAMAPVASVPVQTAAPPRETQAAAAVPAPRQAVLATPLPSPLAEATASMSPLPELRPAKQEPQPKQVGSEDHPDFQLFVQVASVTSESDAMFEWQRLTKKMPQMLAGKAPTITPADVAGKTFWRLRTFGFGNLQEALNLCTRLMDAGWKCRTGRGL